MLPETISMAEAMERYKCDRKPIMTAVSRGEIEAYKPGLRYQIVLSSGDKWYESTRIKPVGRPRGRDRRR